MRQEKRTHPVMPPAAGGNDSPQTPSLGGCITYIKVWCPDGPCPDSGLTPDDVAALWRLSRDEGLLAVIGRDMDALRLGQFVRLVSRSDVFFAVYGTDGEPLAYVYLTHKEGRSARIHFAAFRAGRPDALSLGSMALDFLFGLGCWDSLVGVIPAPFRAAIRFARNLGGGDRGEIPGMCWMARQNRAVAGRQFIFTREV